MLSRPAEFDSGLIYGATHESVTVRNVRLFPGMGPETLEKLLGKFKFSVYNHLLQYDIEDETCLESITLSNERVKACFNSKALFQPSKPTKILGNRRPRFRERNRQQDLGFDQRN